MFLINGHFFPLIFSFGFIILVGGCNHLMTNPSQSQASNESSIYELRNDKLPTKYQRVFLKGEIILGNEMKMMSPCDSDTEYWLSIPSEQINHVYEKISAPYGSIYAEVFGVFSAPPKEGPAANFTAIFNVSQLNMISAEINGCDKIITPRLAFGQEPFWTMSLFGNALNFHRLDDELKAHSINNLTKTKNTQIYQADGALLTLNAELCSDSMSDTVYGWSSILTRNEETLKGCASEVNEEIIPSLFGVYQSVNDSTTAEFTLALTSDHMALIEYESEIGDVVKESGVWQSLDKNEIEIISSRYQGQYLITKRIFKRNDIHLTGGDIALAENTNDQKMEPLTLFRIKSDKMKSFFAIKNE